MFLNGKPVILIDNGKIIRKNLKKHFINVDFSVIKKEQIRPVTPKDLNKVAKQVDLPLVIINDGKLFEKNLKKSGVNEEWLMSNLKSFNIATIDKFIYSKSRVKIL